MAAKESRRRRAINAATLADLGVERLARLVMAQTEVDPVFARAVRMELAGKDDAGTLAHELEKRLKTIRRSRGFVEWDKIGPLARELDQLRASIAGPLADALPSHAVELLRLFLALAPSLFERADDSRGELGSIFRRSGEDLGKLMVRTGVLDTAALAGDILALIEADEYGVFDELPDAASPALGTDGRATLRRLILERQAALSGPERRSFDFKAGWLLPKLADLDGDVDAYIATVDPTRRNPLLNAEVARRLIDHDRAEEALGWIDAPADHVHNDQVLAGLRLRAFVVLGRKDDAQAQRWAIFERWLDITMLRDWLKNLPDFEDFDAEQKALEQVMLHGDATAVLKFLIEWPDIRRAGRLVHDRLSELSHRAYDVLRPAADTLSSAQPDAACQLYRWLVEGVLDRAASKYYVYAARDFASAAALADRIGANGPAPAHEMWLIDLRKTHGRKIGFWNQVAGKFS